LTVKGELFRPELLNGNDEGVNEGVKLELEQLYEQILKYPGNRRVSSMSKLIRVLPRPKELESPEGARFHRV